MRTTKKAISIVLAGLMTVGGMSVFSVSAAQTSTPTLSFKTQNALYAHAVSGSDDSDAWVAWQCKHNEDMEELNTNRKYFFLPSSVSSTSVELYNAYSKSVTVNNVTIPSGELNLWKILIKETVNKPNIKSAIYYFQFDRQ